MYTSEVGSFPHEVASIVSKTLLFRSTEARGGDTHNGNRITLEGYGVEFYTFAKKKGLRIRAIVALYVWNFTANPPRGITRYRTPLLLSSAALRRNIIPEAELRPPLSGARSTEGAAFSAHKPMYTREMAAFPREVTLFALQQQ